jgi:hypothetical protein
MHSPACRVLVDGPHAHYPCMPPYAAGTHLCCGCVGPVLEYPAHRFWAPRALRVGPKARGAQRRVVQATSEPWVWHNLFLQMLLGALSGYIFLYLWLPGGQRIELTRLLGCMIWVSRRWDAGDQAIYNRAC